MSGVLNFFAIIGAIINIPIAIHITNNMLNVYIFMGIITLNVFNIIENANESKSLRKENKPNSGFHIVLSVISGLIGVLLPLILGIYFFNNPLGGERKW